MALDWRKNIVDPMSASAAVKAVAACGAGSHATSLRADLRVSSEAPVSGDDLPNGALRGQLHK